VNEKYVKNGWENHMLLFDRYNEDSPEINEAKKKEYKKWWE
jgi:hypothetical protein